MLQKINTFINKELDSIVSDITEITAIKVENNPITIKDCFE